MTHAEAQARCAELNEAAAGEQGVRWMPRETSPGEWSTVRLRVPGCGRRGR
jgi:hypothetical protein